VIPEQAMKILEARERDSVAVSFDKIKKQLEVGVLETSAMMGNATTFVAGEYVMMYPPGVPILVPGEKVTLKVLELIEGVVDEVKILM
jgi:arginine/lysine/ornithine decarboxylase